MYIITNKKEYAFWITDTIFDRKSGYWYFFDNSDEYDEELEYFTKHKYKKAQVFTIKHVEKLQKLRSEL